MKTQKSEQAQVAALCRGYLKTLGVKCRATSSSFSMGDSVDVTIYDQPPATVERITNEFKKYQYGHFDGMQDIYETSNRRDDIPQTKYLHISHNISDSLKQECWAWLQANFNYGEVQNLPPAYADARHKQLSTDGFRDNASDLVYKTIGGGGLCANSTEGVDFWAQRTLKPLATVTPISAGAASVEEHIHTKKGFKMFIVLTPRTDRAQYDAMLATARELGGWYSRKWGTTPAGFAFKEQTAAQTFLDSAQGATPGTPAPVAVKNNADKLRKLADALTDKISDRLNSERLINTPKRVAQAAHARIEGERLARTQTVLNALADMHNAGDVPRALAGIVSKKAVYDAMHAKLEQVANGYHGYHIDTGAMPENSDALTVQMWGLLKPKSQADKDNEQLARDIEALQFARIPGYFPTPPAVVAQMIEAAQLGADVSVLEPSAGSGAIADAVRDNCANVTVCEINHTLRSILTRKGYAVIDRDFREYDGATYDRILMNPPFELLQDAAHVRHAFDLLNDGGRLVAVMSPSVFYRSDKKCCAWREWFDRVGGEKIELPANSFKQSGTGVNSVLVTINNTNGA